MRSEIEKLLNDVLIASEDIKRFVGELTFSEFQENDMVQRAVEREFEIIGEALKRIRDMDEEVLVQVSDYHKIIGFRNVIAHGYDVIEERMIWQAVKENLPVLITEINALLK